MTYAVKETFYSLQGEGARAGRPATFIRFAGCNLWNGQESARSAAACRFCDTDFVGTNGGGGGKFESAAALAQHAADMWPSGQRNRYVVLTGGEPLLQVDSRLVGELHARDFETAIETNGTLPLPCRILWVTVSPKVGSPLSLRFGDELKMVYPQPGFVASAYESLPFQHFYVQPMDGPNRVENEAAAVEFCKANPHWKLSLQSHKYLGIR